jgi:hypothetical protein
MASIIMGDRAQRITAAQDRAARTASVAIEGNRPRSGAAPALGGSERLTVPGAYYALDQLIDA